LNEKPGGRQKIAPNSDCVINGMAVKPVGRQSPFSTRFCTAGKGLVVIQRKITERIYDNDAGDIDQHEKSHVEPILRFAPSSTTNNLLGNPDLSGATPGAEFRGFAPRSGDLPGPGFFRENNRGQ